MNKVKVTFAIISYNAEKSIRKCIESIIAIPYLEKEIILVDDSSTDSTVKIAEEFLIKIIIKDTSEKGIGWSRNVAFKNATGDFLFIIDSDIEIEECNVVSIIHEFSNDPELAGISGNYNVENADESNLNYLLDLRRQFISLKGIESFKYGLLNYTTFSGGFCCIKLDQVSKRSLFNNNTQSSAEDLIWQIEALNKDYKFMYMSNFVGIHHHFRDNSFFIKKLKQEVRGYLWLLKYMSSKNLRLPSLESVNNFPLFFLIAVIFLFINPLVTIPAFFFDIFPYINLLISKDVSVRSKYNLLFFMTLKKILMIVYLFRELFNIRNINHFRYVISSILFSDIEAKANFFITSWKLIYAKRFIQIYK